MQYNGLKMKATHTNTKNKSCNQRQKNCTEATQRQRGLEDCDLQSKNVRRTPSRNAGLVCRTTQNDRANRYDGRDKGIRLLPHAACRTKRVEIDIVAPRTPVVRIPSTVVLFTTHRTTRAQRRRTYEFLFLSASDRTNKWG